jgi:hypothetical protein
MTRQERSIVAPSRSGALSARARVTARRTSAPSRRPGPLETARSAGRAAVARLVVFTAATLPEFGGSDDSVSLLQRSAHAATASFRAAGRRLGGALSAQAASGP